MIAAFPEPISRLASRLRNGEITPLDLVQACLEAVDREESRLNSFITLRREESLRDAERATEALYRGEVQGPLHGIPIAVKDLIHMEGTLTTCGSRIMADHRSTFDATVVSRLKQAGAILIGKTNLHEFAFGVTTENPHFGTTPNPWDTGRIAGGSSGGSAVAVVAGFCSGALGTDTGGSVRIPAALSGCVGLKPTFGRVSVHGVVELAQSLDCVGPLTSCVEDAALLLQTIAGWDPLDGHSRDIPLPRYAKGLDEVGRGYRLGVIRRHFFEHLDAEVAHAVEGAIDKLRTLGFRVIEHDVACLSEAHAATLPILAAEAATFHEQHLKARRGDYGSDVREMLEMGARLPASDYVRALRTREVARHAFARLFEEVDILVLPTVPIPAPPRFDLEGQGKSGSNRLRPLLTQNTRLFNLLGLPAISLPCGRTSAGLPIGLQLAGPWWGERRLLQVAALYEASTPWQQAFSRIRSRPADPPERSGLRRTPSPGS